MAFIVEMPCAGSSIKDEFHPRSKFQRCRPVYFQEFLHWYHMRQPLLAGCAGSLAQSGQITCTSCPSWTDQQCSIFNLWASQSLKQCVESFWATNEFEDIVYGYSESWRKVANFVKKIILSIGFACSSFYFWVPRTVASRCQMVLHYCDSKSEQLTLLQPLMSHSNFQDNPSVHVAFRTIRTNVC